MFFASQGDGHHPGMAFHASFVALFNGEGQRIVSGIASGFSCQYGVEGFDVRTIKHITTGTSLEKYRIEVGLFQAVEDIDQFFFLSPDTCRSGCFGAWPVQSVDRTSCFGEVCAWSGSKERRKRKRRDVPLPALFFTEKDSLWLL